MARATGGARPPPPSSYVQSWLDRGEGKGDKHASTSSSSPSVEKLEADVLASVKVDAPKGAAKDLVSRVFPRLAAHDVPDLVTVPALTHMLLDGAVAERYAVRYAHYFLQRVFEHHGRADLAASHPDARDAVAALTKCAKEGTGARQLLATRALVAAARAGVPEARDALDDAVAAPLATLSAGKHPRSSSSSFSSAARRSASVFTSAPAAGTDPAARAALGARLRLPPRPLDDRAASSDRAAPSAAVRTLRPGPDPGAGASAASSSHGAHVPAAAIATAAASTDIIVVRHAWAAALRVATDGAEDDVATLAEALEPVVDARARAFAARASAAAEAHRAADDTSRAAANKRLRSAAKEAARAGGDDSAASAAAARACGTIRARRLGAGGDRFASACGAFLDRLVADREDETFGTSRGRDESKQSPKQTRATASKQTTKQKRASSVSSVTTRSALAAILGAAAADAPRGNAGAAARAAAWTALAGDDHREETPREDSPALAAYADVVVDVLALDARRVAGAARRSTACRAAAALGASRRAADSRAGEGAAAKLLAATRAVAVSEDESPGVRVEAMRAMLWLQTPTFAASRDVADVVAGLLRRDEHQESFAKNGIGEGAFERVDPFAHAEFASGPGSVGDEWRGCDAMARLLAAVAERTATASAAASAETSDAWTRLALDGMLALLAAGPRSAPPDAVVDALLAAQRAARADRRPLVLAAACEAVNIARRGDAGELETCVAWYVGEYANFLAAEYAWESAGGAETIGSETDPSSDGSAVARASPISETDEDVLARASARNPPLAAAVAATQRSALASPRWTTKTAAIRALAVIAVRSGEPFRLGCYGALRAMQRAMRMDPNDAVGPQGAAQQVDAAVATLDHCYRGAARFREMEARLGPDPSRWPPAALAETAGRRAVLLELTARVCFLPREKYEPLGAASAAFAEAFTGDVAAAASLAARLMGKEAADAEEARRKEKRVAEGVLAAFRAKSDANGGGGGVGLGTSSSKGKGVGFALPAP